MATDEILLTNGNLFTGAAKLINPEVLVNPGELATANRVAGCTGEDEFPPSPFLLWMVPALAYFLKHSRGNQLPLGKLLGERLGVFGSYLFVKISEATSENDVPSATEIEDRKFGEAIISIFGLEDLQVVVGALILISETFKRFVGQDAISVREFILGMREPAQEIRTQRTKVLTGDDKTTKTSLRVGMQQFAQIKQEQELAATIAAAMARCYGRSRRP